MRDLKLPIAALLALLSIALMMLPMPSWVLDVLFTFNIGLGMIILLGSLKSERPLDFSSFPSALLLATLLRLSLNVASTRLILSEGHTGTGAAGHVVEAFGTFLLGGNFLVGFMIFAILLIINFAVITKGAGRIAEVSARFALDALPGKQMAIDADLSAGLIGEKEARERREDVGREADFYGSMDGASKFVRGDAVAALLIFFLGSIGGVVVGIFYHGMGASESANAYLPMAVGDAIASQVPALLLSMAAGILVSKAGSKGDISKSLLDQIGKVGPMRQSSIAMAALGVLPGMPNVPFLLFALALWLFTTYQERMKSTALRQEESQKEQAAVTKNKDQSAQVKELSWEDLGDDDRLIMEIGYRLIPLADPAQGGDFLAKARALRKKFADTMGFLPPPLRVRDNLDLAPGQVRLIIRGIVVAEATLRAEGLMCLREHSSGPWPVPGTEGVDPAFGLPALWIEPAYEASARAAGLAVVSPSAALATLFSKILSDHAKALFGMSELKGLLEWKFKDAKALAEWVPGQLSHSMLLKICKELLEERVPLKDFEAILADSILIGKKSDDPVVVAEAVRKSLGSSIAAEAFSGSRSGRAYIVDEGLENLILQGLSQPMPAVEPELARRLIRAVSQKAKEEEALGGRFVLMVSDRARQGVARLLRRAEEDIRVLAYGEIPDGWKIEVVGAVG